MIAVDPGNTPAFPGDAAAGHAGGAAGVAKRGHVESYFIKLNSPDGARALWVKWTLFAEPGRAPRAECWAVAFARGRVPVAFKRSMPAAAAVVRAEPFGLDFDGARFDGARARGEVLSGAARIEWDFRLAPRVPALSPLPYAWMYRGRFPETKFNSPLPDATASGWYELDGVRVDVSGWRAMQGHNWGARHTHRYAWCHAAGFDGREGGDVVFEGVSVRLQRAGVELPWVTLAHLWMDGRWLRFDAPRVIAAARAEASVLRWAFRTEAGGYRLEGEARAAREETVGLHYHNPDGTVTYCLNSKLAALSLRVAGPRGTQTFETSRAALELGWPTADHGVVMRA